MRFFNVAYCDFVLWSIIGLMQIQGYNAYHYYDKTKCLNPPRTARKVETYIKECQDEVKNKLVQEAFSILKQEVSKIQQHPNPNDDLELIETVEHPTQDILWEDIAEAEEHILHEANQNIFDYATHHESPRGHMSRLMERIGRVEDVSNGIYHPTLVPFEDKRIAGCLLHCVYAKNNAIDKKGWPTLDGLVDFYSGGVNEHDFFMATLRSVNLCLRAVTSKYHVDRRKLPEKGESCDLAFDVFDCISDQITGYCMDQYRS